jgi:hypothetical protein
MCAEFEACLQKLYFHEFATINLNTFLCIHIFFFDTDYTNSGIL